MQFIPKYADVPFSSTSLDESDIIVTPGDVKRPYEEIGYLAINVTNTGYSGQTINLKFKEKYFEKTKKRKQI